jgi:hypothetical protein
MQLAEDLDPAVQQLKLWGDRKASSFLPAASRPTQLLRPRMAFQPTMPLSPKILSISLTTWHLTGLFVPHAYFRMMRLIRLHLATLLYRATYKNKTYGGNVAI